MSYGEELFRLRKRVADAVSTGVIDPNNKDILEALMIQIMNDAERNRQQCVSQAESLRKQAATLDGQAGAFASVSSIVYNVLNGFVQAAEREKQEDIRAEQENSEKQEYAVQQGELAREVKGKKKK